MTYNYRKHTLAYNNDYPILDSKLGPNVIMHDIDVTILSFQFITSIYGKDYYVLLYKCPSTMSTK